MLGKNKIRQEVLVAKDSDEDVESHKGFVIYFGQVTAKQAKRDH